MRSDILRSSAEFGEFCLIVAHLDAQSFLFSFSPYDAQAGFIHNITDQMM